MMRVLHYSPMPKRRAEGGISILGRALMENKNKFFNNDVDIEFFNSYQYESDNEKVGKVCWETLYNYLLIIKRILKEIKEKDITHVHICTSVKLALLKDIILIRIIKTFFNVEIILHIHSCDINSILLNSQKINKFILKSINKYCDKIITLSLGFKDELKSIGIDEKKLFKLYNFQYCIKKQVNKKKNHILNGLYLGQLTEAKGVIDLLNAVDINMKGKINIYFAGKFMSEEIEKIFYKTIDEREIDGIVKYIGFISGDEKAKILMDTDMLFLPSYSEGMPISIVEGICAGCYIVTTDVGAISEIVTDNINGKLFKKGDVMKLNTIINNTINDKYEMQKIQKNNLKRFEEFKIDKYIVDLSNIYKEKKLR